MLRRCPTTREDIISTYQLADFEAARLRLNELRETGVLESDMGYESLEVFQAHTDFLETVLQEAKIKRSDLNGLIEVLESMSKQAHNQIKYCSITLSQLQKRQ